MPTFRLHTTPLFPFLLLLLTTTHTTTSASELSPLSLTADLPQTLSFTLTQQINNANSYVFVPLLLPTPPLQSEPALLVLDITVDGMERSNQSAVSEMLVWKRSTAGGSEVWSLDQLQHLSAYVTPTYDVHVTTEMPIQFPLCESEDQIYLLFTSLNGTISIHVNVLFTKPSTPTCVTLTLSSATSWNLPANTPLHIRIPELSELAYSKNKYFNLDFSENAPKVRELFYSIEKVAYWPGYPMVNGQSGNFDGPTKCCYAQCEADYAYDWVYGGRCAGFGGQQKILLSSVYVVVVMSEDVTLTVTATIHNATCFGLAKYVQPTRTRRQILFEAFLFGSPTLIMAASLALIVVRQRRAAQAQSGDDVVEPAKTNPKEKEKEKEKKSEKSGKSKANREATGKTSK